MDGRSDAGVDYRSGDAWRRLAALFGRAEPRPDPRCGLVRCEPGWHWRTDLTDFDLWLAIAGRGRFDLRHETHPIRPGTLFWLRPGDEGLATQDPDDPLTVVYVHFAFFAAGSDCQVAIAADLLPDRYLPLRDPTRIETLLTRVVRLQQLPVPLGEVESRLLLHQAILEAYRQDAVNHGVPGAEPDPRIALVLAHLHTQPAERVSLARAAVLAGLSPDRFSRLFRLHTGTPFRRYALNARLERARHLLEETGLGVGEVARALGYADVFLLSRQFKARYGVPPTHLRHPPDRSGPVNR